MVLLRSSREDGTRDAPLRWGIVGGTFGGLLPGVVALPPSFHYGVPSRARPRANFLSPFGALNMRPRREKLPPRGGQKSLVAWISLD